MSLASTLSHDTMERIRARWNLGEVHGSDGGPYLPLTSAAGGQPIGSVRILTGPPLAKLVYIGMVVPQFGIDSHMLFAFAPSTSAVPHFTLDSVWAGDSFAFHLDLVPRVDLAANLPYLDAVMEPLTATFVAAQKLEGLRPAVLLPRQTAQMSPWMLACRANEAAFAQIGPSVTAYLEHWFALFDRAIPIVDSDEHSLALRDRRNRSAIFSPAVDPVWARVERVIGADSGARLRSILTNPGVES